MNERAITARAIIPSFRYHDAPGAIAFLCDAFGFAKHAVYDGPDGTIAHAQLALGAHVISLGSESNDRRGWPDRTPHELGETSGNMYVVLETDDDVDAHCARARAAGAKIIDEPSSPERGGRSHGVADCEGYLWCFGSYRPES